MDEAVWIGKSRMSDGQRPTQVVRNFLQGIQLMSSSWALLKQTLAALGDCKGDFSEGCGGQSPDKLCLAVTYSFSAIGNWVFSTSEGLRISKTGNRAPAVCIAFPPQFCTFMLSEIVLPYTWLGAFVATAGSAILAEPQDETPIPTAPEKVTIYLVALLTKYSLAKAGVQGGVWGWIAAQLAYTFCSSFLASQAGDPSTVTGLSGKAHGMLVLITVLSHGQAGYSGTVTGLSGKAHGMLVLITVLSQGFAFQPDRVISSTHLETQDPGPHMNSRAVDLSHAVRGHVMILWVHLYRGNFGSGAARYE
ncbi:hypothetical protein AK812_SmicGene37314 [Symbiodinium microadriaticum]|uniref:Uncharacterized protein n=1 Tax=Symbiodinium microadriaticum TaxID=2951 RepID=A0A1Q9CGK4_SYMMI|nr:hypothetical protein AK812_SmicGene37314 [Symbiodinium microadriaticum]